MRGMRDMAATGENMALTLKVHSGTSCFQGTTTRQAWLAGETPRILGKTLPQQYT